MFDDPTVAARTHRAGLRRLFALQFKEQLKFLEKNIPGLQQMGMQFMALGTPEELREQIIEKALDRAFLQDPLPTDAASFNKRTDEGKARARPAGQRDRAPGGAGPGRVPRPAASKLQGVHAAQAAARHAGAAAAAWCTSASSPTPSTAQLAHLPRYLKAINVRLDKLRADPARDAKLMAEWRPRRAQFLRTVEEPAAARTSIRA